MDVRNVVTCNTAQCKAWNWHWVLKNAFITDELFILKVMNFLWKIDPSLFKIFTTNITEKIFITDPNTKFTRKKYTFTSAESKCIPYRLHPSRSEGDSKKLIQLSKMVKTETRLSNPMSRNSQSLTSLTFTWSSFLHTGFFLVLI